VDRYGNPGPAYERCLEKVREDWVVLIHPEGTRTRDGTLGAFKHGAAKLSIEGDRPIVPVKIEGGYAVYPWDRSLPKLFDLRHMRRYELTIRFGKPLLPLGRSVEGLTRELSEAVIHL
jgi:1-acyl-sn-glycerol-3-phosphate acyltransferase